MSSTSKKKVKKQFNWAFDGTTQFASSDDSEPELELPLRPTNNPIPRNSDLAVNKSISVSTALVPNASDFPPTPSRPSDYAHISSQAFQRRNARTLSEMSQSGSASSQHLPVKSDQRKRAMVSNASNFPAISSRTSDNAHISTSQAFQNRDAQTLSGISQSHGFASSQRLPDIRYDQRKRAMVPNASNFPPTSSRSFPDMGCSLSSSSPPSHRYDDGTLDYDPHTPYCSSTQSVRKSPFRPSLNEGRHVQGPPASLLPSMSSISSDYLTRKHIPYDSLSGDMQVKSNPKLDAYRLSTEDSDEEWTTLPSKKRKRKPKTVLPGDPTFTKSFRIPGLRLHTMKAESITAPAARRTKIYLPPPPNSVGATTEKNNLNMKETEGEEPVSPPAPTNFDADPYPSPSTSGSKVSQVSISQAKSASSYTPPRSRFGVRAYRPPSPPTSDLPIPSDADIYMDVDHEGIALRYPETKQLSRKRKRASADVWTLLNLDSCGYVRKDVECGGQEEQMELQIVMWPQAPV